MTLVALDRLVKAGRYMAGLTFVKTGWTSDFSVANIKSLSPKTKVVYRIWRQNEPGYDWNKVWRSDGIAHANDYYSQFDSADLRLADYDQMINEPGYGEPTHVAAFWQGVLDVAEQKGRKITLFNYAERNPPLPIINANQPWSDFWKSPAIVALLRRAKAGGHIMLLHQYVINESNQQQGTCFDWQKTTFQQECLYRHQLIYKLFPADLQDMPLWIGELGDIQMPKCGPEHLKDSIRKFKAATAHDSYIVAAALWSWGNGGAPEWLNDDLWQFTGAYVEAVLE